MSIECNGAQASHKAVAGAQAQGGKGKAKMGTESDSLAGGGFLSLLSSLGFQSGDVAADLTDQGGDSQTSANGNDFALTQMLPSLGHSDALVSSTQSEPIDMAMLLAQAGQLAGDKLNSLGSGALNRSDTATVALGGGVAEARISVTAPATTAAEKQEAAASAVLVAGKKGGGGRPADALLAAQSGLSHLQLKVPGDSPAVGNVGIAESRVKRSEVLADMVARESMVSATLFASGFGEGVVRQGEKSSAKSPGLQVGSESAGGWGGQAFQVNSGVDTPSFVVDPSAVSFESMVADTVSYWTTQGIQNAELKLDGFGSQPVEVSISLNGDEAHIGFRTDQPEIRNILEGAVAHLKELLTSEGLVLSGFSIGTSGQGGANSQDRRDQSGTRQAMIAVKEAQQTSERPQRVNLSSVGRALDLFV